MKFTTDLKLETFLLETRWEDLPSEVQQRLRGCMLDLLGALIAGSGSEQFRVGVRLAKKLFQGGDVAAIGTQETFSAVGAATAMGHSSNAYDIDDGHNLIRAHPGTSFIGGLLATGYEKDVDAREFLTALYVAYESTIRMGAAIMDYYQYAHSSGTFGAVGVVAGAGRMYGFTREQMNNALSVAEFNAPLVPGIRSVEYPSMNKDGVPFGVMVGELALQAGMCGFTGNKNLLEAEEYGHYLDDLGEKHEVMNLYFKPYPCCRWGHPAIDACLAVMQDNNVKAEDIEKVFVETFFKATQLSKGIPASADEAQYNIAYPVASSIVNGGFSIAQVEQTDDPAVHAMMEKLEFLCDAQLDAQFPAKRLCRVRMVLKDGRTVVSGVHEPRGEAFENIGYDWLAEKFLRITGHKLTRAQQDELIAVLRNDSWTVRQLTEKVNGFLLK
ncbi:MAG: MmgE/PrpD family protein [Ruminococcaceae bacterium]|nr:MmgE/PrpD family protein [Oscillospiraceae bacterium]